MELTLTKGQKIDLSNAGKATNAIPVKVGIKVDTEEYAAVLMDANGNLRKPTDDDMKNLESILAEEGII